MNIFLDTEFTDFFNTHLISLGMAAEHGEEFYAEVPYPDHACSAFVREGVIPLLGKNQHAFFTKDNLRIEILKWLKLVRRGDADVFICVDYQTDWDLFIDALDYRVPAWCHLKHVYNEVGELLVYDFFKSTGLPQHHALYDAQANRYAYRPSI